MTHALVTGGAGAIGSTLCAALLQRGVRVTAIDDLSSGHRSLVPDGVTFIEGSVTDQAAVEAAFAGKPDWVFHLAALFANQNSVEHPKADLAVNGAGTLNVLETAYRFRTRKLLYTSSSCVYGAKPVMREDDTDLDLDTPYAVTKLLGEHYAGLWSRLYGFNTVIIRLFNSYGPHEYPGPYRNVIPNFFKLAMEKKPLPITGTGQETRDFTYNGDTVAGIVGAMLAETAPGSIFNIASGREETILSIAEKINRLAHNPAGIEYRPRRSWDRVTQRRGDIERARTAFGFAPTVGIDDGLKRTFAWLKSVLP